MTLSSWLRVMAVMVTLVASIYFIGYAAEHIRGLPPIASGPATWVLLIFSVFLWVGITLLGALIWRSLLADLKYRLTLRACLVIYGIAQFGKYLPGNVGHHVGRVVLAKQAGIPVTSTLQTMLIEVAWGGGVAAGIALLGIVLGSGIDVSPEILALFFVAALLAPWLGWIVVSGLFPRLIERIVKGKPVTPPRLHTMLSVGLLYLLAFLGVGLLLDLHARLLFDASSSHVLMLTVAFAWSWIAGYITPGAPGGLGVREAVLVTALTPMYGASISVGLTLLLRMVTTLGDGLAFLMATGARHFLGPDIRRA